VLTVPVQAIVQVGKETACYVAGQPAPQRRAVKLGRTNDKLVQILDGVRAGDRVVLNPMGIAEEAERPAGEAAEPAEQISAAPNAQPAAASAPTVREPRRAASGPQTAKAS